MAEARNPRPKASAGAATLDEAGVVAAYARWAPVYDRVFGALIGSSCRAAAAAVNRLPAGRVLEVGVGTGIALPLYDKKHRIVGIDLSPDMLERARKRVAEQGMGNVEAILEMDASHLTFQEASFDAVVAMFVMPVVPDPERVMSELARVAKPGGRVVVVNHFAANGGPIAVIERFMSRYSTSLGWHPGFRIERILGRPELTLSSRRRMHPLGLYQLVEFDRL